MQCFDIFKEFHSAIWMSVYSEWFFHVLQLYCDAPLKIKNDRHSVLITLHVALHPDDSLLFFVVACISVRPRHRMRSLQFITVKTPSDVYPLFGHGISMQVVPNGWLFIDSATHTGGLRLIIAYRLSSPVMKSCQQGYNAVTIDCRYVLFNLN